MFIIVSVISNNIGSGILASDSSTTIQVTNTAIVGNGVGLLAASNASINSSGDNVVLGNSNNGVFKAIIAKN